VNHLPSIKLLNPTDQQEEEKDNGLKNMKTINYAEDEEEFLEKVEKEILSYLNTIGIKKVQPAEKELDYFSELRQRAFQGRR